MENSFAHHGVLGMKWGVRRYQNKDGTLTAAGRKRQQDNTSEKPQSSGSKAGKSNTSSKKAAPQQPTYKTLSDDELRARISRLELEKKYKELSANPKKSSRGRDFVMDVLEKSGKDIASQLSAYAMGAAVNKLAGKDIVDPKLMQKKKK